MSSPLSRARCRASSWRLFVRRVNDGDTASPASAARELRVDLVEDRGKLRAALACARGGQRADGLARVMQVVHHPEPRSRCKRCVATTRRMRWRERSDARRGCRYPPRRRTRGSSARRSRCRTSCRNARETRELPHRSERRFDPLDGLRRAEPSRNRARGDADRK